MEDIISTKFFVAAIQTLYDYEWNNMYQKSFEQIINLIMFKSTPEELIFHVMIECGFGEKIIEHIINQKFTYLYKYYYLFKQIRKTNQFWKLSSVM